MTSFEYSIAADGGSHFAEATAGFASKEGGTRSQDMVWICDMMIRHQHLRPEKHISHMHMGSYGFVPK